jgi:hypothetical protein
MKLLLHPAIAAVGLSVLFFLGFIEPLVNPNHHWIYQDNSAPASVFVPVLLNVGIVWIVLTLLLWAAEKPGRLRVFVWSGLFVAIPLMLVEDGIQLELCSIPHWLGRTLIFTACLWMGAFTAVWRPSFLHAFESAQHFAHTVLAFASLGAILLIGQSGWCFWQARGLLTPRPLRSSDPQMSLKASPMSRVIWIILDELSYQQVYERRFPGLELPAFDRLASQSTLFTQVRPAAEYTEFAVPSLLTGLRADHIRAGADGSLLTLHTPLTHSWQPFHPENTVFQDALDEGYTTAIAGWYIPYCRILAPVLNRCRWTYSEDYDRWMLAGASIRANTLAPWLRFASRFVPNDYRDDRFPIHPARLHIADYQQLAADSDQMLNDDGARFLLIHMPAPHPGGIYDRRTGQFTTHGASYIDNLALADRYLAHVRQLLSQRGEWDSSTIIVMGDHSWRTRLVWRASPIWTNEDEAASHDGLFDDRPAYIVKLPRQSSPARVDTPFDAVNTRMLLKAILSGEIQSPAQLAALAASLRRPPLDMTQASSPR